MHFPFNKLILSLRCHVQLPICQHISINESQRLMHCARLYNFKGITIVPSDLLFQRGAT